METCVQPPAPVRIQFACPSMSEVSRHSPAADVSIQRDEAMKGKTDALRAMGWGLLLTAAQIFVAVVLLAPPGAFLDRYHSLAQHDSYWFANIVDRGYATIVP